MPLLLTFFCISAHLDYLDLAAAEQRLPLSVGGVDAEGWLRKGDAKGWWHATLTDDIGDVLCTDICAFLVLPFGTLCVECDAMLKWLQRLHCCCC